METFFTIILALIIPVYALQRVPVALCPPLWYVSGALLIGHGLQVLPWVCSVLGTVFLYLCCSASDSSATTKKP